MAKKNDEFRHEKLELETYAYNTGELHNQFNSIISNLKRKIKRGVYDPIKAPQLWMYWLDEAARRYCREFGCQVRIMFPLHVRQELATDIARDEYSKIKSGEYNHIEPSLRGSRSCGRIRRLFGMC